MDRYYIFREIATGRQAVWSDEHWCWHYLDGSPMENDEDHSKIELVFVEATDDTQTIKVGEIGEPTQAYGEFT